MKNQLSSSIRILLKLVLGFVLFMSSSSARAQNLFWDANGATAGTGGTGNWLTAGTWRDGSAAGTVASITVANGIITGITTR